MDRNEKERLLLDLLPLIRSEAGIAARHSRWAAFDDLVQEASIATWIALDHHDPSLSPLIPFVAICIRTRFKSLWKAAHRPKRFLNYQPGEVTETVSDHRSDPYQEQMIFNDTIRINLCQERELLIKHFYEGYTFQEIAGQQHLSWQRIQQKTNAAVDRLRRRELRAK